VARFEAFSDALRMEMKDWGVKVVIVEPGFFNTPLVQRAAEATEALYRSLPEVRYSVFLHHAAACCCMLLLLLLLCFRVFLLC